MKKTNNKGFSLVELIIVIAIMAILAGAIAPALIRYIDKSRKSNDVSSAKAIKTAVETALGNESVYELLTTGDEYCYIYITPGEETASYADLDCITIEGEGKGDGATDKAAGKINGKDVAEVEKMAENEIATNIGEKTPKLKYKKNAAKKDAEEVPTEFVAVVSKKGSVYVYISVVDAGTFSFTEGAGKDTKTSEPFSSDAKKGFQICPNVCDEYQ